MKRDKIIVKLHPEVIKFLEIMSKTCYASEIYEYDIPFRIRSTAKQDLFTLKHKKDIAVEFAEWILSKDNPKFSITTMNDRESDKEISIWGTNRVGDNKFFTSGELFEQFLKERNING